MRRGSVKVVIDTNVWRSFLIGKRLAQLKHHLSSGKIQVVTCPELMEELREVTSRPKLRGYFPAAEVSNLFSLLDVIAIHVDVTVRKPLCRDPKDDFLLALVEKSKADYLVTGDKDLLIHDPFGLARILSPSAFEEEMERS